MDKNLEKLIDFAISEEEKAKALYQDLSIKVSDKGAKTMLREMADMENGHALKLKDFKISKSTVFIKDDAPNLMLAEYMVENKLTSESTAQEVILFAIQCEKKSWQMYSDLSRSFKDKSRHDLMAAMASEELHHKNLLEKAYDDIIFKEN